MIKKTVTIALLAVFCLTSIAYCGEMGASSKRRIIVVDSYHKAYPSTTHIGFCDGMLKYGYFDNRAQSDEFEKNDYVESKKAVVKRLWMDTKRALTADEMEFITVTMTKSIKEFKPDIILLGEDNAANYIGNRFLDTKIPVVFWGVNNTPVKYGLVNSMEAPGHNVTGVYQAGYEKESIELLLKIVPTIKRFAILSDDTNTARARSKKVERLAYNNLLKVKLVESVAESNYKKWQEAALMLQKKVDALFIPQFSGLMHDDGTRVPVKDALSWYIKNIKIPEASGPPFGVRFGLLCTVSDSSHDLGFKGVAIAHDILENGKNPATYPPMPAKPDARTVNKKRGEMLGITFTKEMGIEEYK
ncbi:ABC transporter substrate-binding protein [Thermodesulfobacteriota bacterium]